MSKQSHMIVSLSALGLLVIDALYLHRPGLMFPSVIAAVMAFNTLSAWRRGERTEMMFYGAFGAGMLVLAVFVAWAG
jgi:hypothetical protein